MAYVLPLRDQFMTEDHGCGVCSFILLISLEGKKNIQGPFKGKICIPAVHMAFGVLTNNIIAGFSCISDKGDAFSGAGETHPTVTPQGHWIGVGRVHVC